MSTFREHFNFLFKSSSLSQEDFGTLINASKFQVFNWRSGRGEPDIKTLKLIATKFCVSVSWLLGETDIRFTIEELMTHEHDIIDMAYRLRQLPQRDRQEVEAYIQFKEAKNKQTKVT
jgi:transcriptional regulator with XRE-family HTH domain